MDVRDLWIKSDRGDGMKEEIKDTNKGLRGKVKINIIPQ